MQNTNKNCSFPLFPTNPVPRTVVTNLNKTKWSGCIYLASSDLTGQVIQFLTARSAEFPHELKKTSIWVFTTKDRSELETRISDTLQMVIRNQRLPTVNLN
jgi:hypothetical protein